MSNNAKYIFFSFAFKSNHADAYEIKSMSRSAGVHLRMHLIFNGIFCITLPPAYYYTNVRVKFN